MNNVPRPLRADNQPACPACSRQVAPVLLARERQFGQPGEFSYGECPGCQALVLINPPDDPGLYYSQGYYSFSGDLPSRGLKRHVVGLVFKNLPAALRWIPGKKARVLDVGCGGGHLVLELMQHGYENIEGIDPFLDESKVTNSQLKIRRARLDEVSSSYDAIMYHHVLEHVADPFTELLAAKERLLPGGRLIIRVPLADSDLFNRFRENWYQLDAPRHAWIPTRKAMEILARRLDLDLRASVDDATVAPLLISRLLVKNKVVEVGLLQCYKNPLLLPLLAWSHLQTAWSHIRSRGDQACFILEKTR